MSSADDLKAYATSDHDFYGLLGVSFENSESDIKRAYHKAVLKYHPDKNHGDPTANVDRFHLVQTAYAVLSDPAVKAAYDNARMARLAKQRQKDLFESKRRKMAEDLELREAGGKRPRVDDADDAEERLAREVRRLAEHGKKMRLDRDEARRRSSLGVFRDGPTAASEEKKEAPSPSAAAVKDEAEAVPEMDRTVRLRWSPDVGGAIDRDRLQEIFSNFGPIEAVIPIKEKRFRLAGKREKQVMATSCIVFASLTAARAAVNDSTRLPESQRNLFESIAWAAERPGLSSPALSSTVDSSPNASPMSTPVSTKSSAFLPPSSSTPSASPSFEATMNRLREAEKKRREVENRKKEAKDEAGPERSVVV